MLNVGLRAYLWEQKPREEKLTREFWSLNGVTYLGFRAFLSDVKDHGMSGLYTQSAGGRLGSLSRQPTSGGTGRSTSHPSTEQDDLASEASAPSSQHSLGLASSLPLGHSPAGGGGLALQEGAFATAQHMFDVDSCPVTVLRFARAASPLLAMGLQSGVVKVGTLAEPPAIVGQFQGHNRAVADLDWSGDNILLLSVGEDGNAVAWDVHARQAVRAVTTEGKVPGRCCAFHPVNANLFMVGDASGAVRVFNCSTGLVLACVEAAHAHGAGPPVAMAATPSLLCVGDTSGTLHTWRAEIRDGQLQPLALLSRQGPPKGTAGSLTSLEYVPYCKATGGPALLSATTDGSVCIWDLDTWTGRPKLKGRGKMLQAEGRLRASMSPLVLPDDPQYMAVGAQDNAVEVFDISDGIRKGPKLVARLTGHASTVTDVCYSSGAALLASSDSMGTVIVWQAVSRR